MPPNVNNSGLRLLALRGRLDKRDRDRVPRLVELLGERGSIPLTDVLIELFPNSKNDKARAASFRQMKKSIDRAAQQVGHDTPIEVAKDGAVSVVRYVAQDYEEVLAQAALVGAPKADPLYDTRRFQPPKVYASQPAPDSTRGAVKASPDQRKLAALRERYHQLERSTKLTRQQRGREFETLLFDMMQHFGMEPGKNARTEVEEVDLHGALGTRTVLIEAKWHGKQVGTKDVNHFHTKVARRRESVAAFFISVSGFTRDAVEGEKTAQRPCVALVTGDDLLAALDGTMSLPILLAAKQFVLEANHQVLIGALEVARNPQLVARAERLLGLPVATPERRTGGLAEALHITAERKDYEIKSVRAYADNQLTFIEVALPSGGLTPTRWHFATWEGPPSGDALLKALEHSPYTTPHFIAVQEHPTLPSPAPDDEKIRRRAFDGRHEEERNWSRGRHQLPTTLLFDDAVERLDAWRRFPEAAATALEIRPPTITRPWIDPALRLDDGEAKDALTALTDWVKRQDGPSLAVLLGEYGSGKTFLCRELARRLIEQLPVEPGTIVPLYLDLREVSATVKEERLTAAQLIAEYLPKVGMEGHHANSVLDAIAAGRLAILFDGFDEHAAHLSPRQVSRLWKELAQLALAPARVLISCRTHFFPSEKEERRRIKGESALLDRNVPAPNSALILYLQPFDRQRIKSFLTKVLGEADGAAFMELLQTIHDLPDLASRPVLLDLLVRLRERIEALAATGRRIGAGQLYELMVEAWLERDSDKHYLAAPEKLELMETLAIEMWRSKSFGLKPDALTKATRKLLIDLFNAADPEKAQIAEADVRTATFLSRSPEGEVRFHHRSFMEFFIARAIVGEIGAGKSERLSVPPLSPEIVEFAHDLLEVDSNGTEAASKLIGSLLTDPEDEPALRDKKANAVRLLVAGQRRAAAHGGARPHWSVGATKLQLARVDLSGADLAQVVWPGADLREADLRHCRLSGANLEGAKLDGANLEDAELEKVNLRRASLRGARCARADLTQADLVGADFEEADLFRARLAEARLADASLRGARLLAANFARAHVSSQQLSAGEGCGFVGPELDRRQVTAQATFGHGGAVTSAAFSPDSGLIVSASGDNTLKIWDAGTGALLRTLTGHESEVTSAAFSPDSCLIVSASLDKTLKIWDAGTGALLRTLTGHEGAVTSAAFSSDSRLTVSASRDNTLKIWDAGTGALLCTLTGHVTWVMSAAFSPDSGLIVSASWDNTLKIWNAGTGALLHTLAGHQEAVMSAAFSPDSGLIVSASWDNTLKIWDAGTGALLRTLTGHENAVTSAAFSPDSGLIVSASWDKTLKIWDAGTGALLRTLTGHEGAVMSAVFSPDSGLIVSASWDNTLKIWDAGTGALLRTLAGHEHAVTSAAFSPDSGLIVSASWDKTLKIWDAGTGALLRTLAGHMNWVTSAVFSPDSGLVVSASEDHTLKIWDAGTGALLRTLAGHDWAVMSAMFSPDSDLIVSASRDNTLKIWDAKSGALRATCFTTPQQGWVALFPDNRFDGNEAGLAHLLLIEKLAHHRLSDFPELFVGSAKQRASS